MSMLSRLLRVVAVIGVALPLAVSTPASAAPSDTSRPAPGSVTAFYADHRERCAYSYTYGAIDWNPMTVTRQPVVQVKGTLVDELQLCANPFPAGRVFARFVGFVQNRLVDERLVYLSVNSDADMVVWSKNFDLLLSSGELRRAIDQVSVQVCRDFGSLLPAFSCGDAQFYHRRQVVPVE